MTKQELLETCSAEQLAEMVIELQNEKEKQYKEIWEQVSRRTGLETYFLSQVNFMGRIREIVCESFEKAKEMTEKNSDSEFKEIIQRKCYCMENKNFQSEVEKYHKAFEDAKKERDCQIAEYQKKIEELKQKLERQETATKYAEEYMDSLKNDLERSKNTINQIDYILEKLFGVRHDTVDTPDEFEKILTEKAKRNVTDFLPTEPIKVADMLINTHKRDLYENSAYYSKIFDIGELRQIAEHLLVYCNHNGEAEE